MTDQYKEQYRKETEQIHAPADLIAKTKAAMRQEEARIQREGAAETAKYGVQETPAVQRMSNRGAAARRWAYPLTVVAAIVVLLSASLMMRGLGKTALDGASYESAADSGAAESATEETLEEAIPEDALVAAEAPAEGSAFDGETDSAASSTGDVENFADETKRAAISDEASSESEKVEDAMSQKQEEKLADSAAESVTVRKVWNKPAFVDRAGTELQTYEDMDFQVREEGDGWIAYVESDNGGGYVIRGKAETMEAFLEAGYQRVLEISL